MLFQPGGTETVLVSVPWTRGGEWPGCAESAHVKAGAMPFIPGV